VQKFGVPSIFDMTKTFTSNFLAISAQGWPDISAYAASYESLLNPVLAFAFTRAGTLGEAIARGELEDAFGPAMDRELNELLYPDPAQIEKLRFGTRGLPPERVGAAFDPESWAWDEEFVGILNDQSEALWTGMGLDAF